jgi:pSer/pThr/pTyr-binding forkhead associated (FHA) protein
MLDLRHLGEIVFGRDPSCDVVLEDLLVSRRHATLVTGPDEVIIEDSSTNGVYVNDVRVEGSVRLHSGDRILVGTTEFSAF